ncbi:hypothetical protein ACS3UN_05270 [Oscillospiraceae bacterium LTW-04]|nr:hypothetical protein RBH76_05095 [Oscillospiraceae bacterium MB24-C1]
MSDAAPNSKTQANGQGDAQQGNKAHSKFHSYTKHNVVAYPQDVLLASVTLALTLSQGRSQYEVETLINLFSLTTDNLQAILAQMLINRKVQTDLETII